MNTPCPTPEAITAIFDGPRPPQHSHDILVHLEGCSACREKLAALLPKIEVPPAFQPEGIWVEAAATSSAKTVENTVVQPLHTTFGVFSPTPQPPVFQLPRKIGGYEVLRILGQGGMGMVLKALDPALNRFVAVKILFPHLAKDNVYRQRFAREARAAATIGSDHATAVYSVGEDGDAPYIVMEFVYGENLETRLGRGGRLPLRVAICIARQVAAGLAAAHLQGIVHRDIKPANIMLESATGLPDDTLIRVKITDFGIARTAGLPGITGSQETVGTPEYMSPEQITGDPLDHRSDLYAFGILLYRMVTEQLPFTGKTAVACFAQHFSKEPPAPSKIVSDVPEWLCALILRLLRKDPNDRIQTALEVVRLLDEGCEKLHGPSTDPEERRLAALRKYQILDSDPEQAYDDLTFLASHICGTPMAVVSLIDEDRQWFKSKVGIEGIQTARNLSFCQYTIRGTTPMIVDNATTDPRFSHHPGVLQEPGIRFYAGVPLIDGEGCALGSLCVVDRVVRGLTPEQLSALTALGRLVMNLLRLRRELLECHAATTTFPTADYPTK